MLIGKENLGSGIFHFCMKLCHCWILCNYHYYSSISFSKSFQHFVSFGLHIGKKSHLLYQDTCHHRYQLKKINTYVVSSIVWLDFSVLQQNTTYSSQNEFVADVSVVVIVLSLCYMLKTFSHKIYIAFSTYI